MRNKKIREELRCVWCRLLFQDKFGKILVRAADHYDGKGGCERFPMNGQIFGDIKNEN